MRRIALLAVVAVASLSACGGDEQPTADVDHDGLVRSYLLTLASFPTGWSEVAPAGESRFFAEECGDVIAGGGRLGLAWTGDFISGAQSVQHVVAIFETKDQLLARLDSAGQWRDCVVEAIEGGKLDTPGVRLSDARFVSLSFPSFADATHAHRFSVRATSTTDGSQTMFFIDDVIVRRGAIGSGFMAGNASEPFDPELLRLLAQEAADKLN